MNKKCLINGLFDTKTSTSPGPIQNVDSLMNKRLPRSHSAASIDSALMTTCKQPKKYSNLNNHVSKLQTNGCRSTKSSTDISTSVNRGITDTDKNLVVDRKTVLENRKLKEVGFQTPNSALLGRYVNPDSSRSETEDSVESNELLTNDKPYTLHSPRRASSAKALSMINSQFRRSKTLAFCPSKSLIPRVSCSGNIDERKFTPHQNVLKRNSKYDVCASAIKQSRKSDPSRQDDLQDCLPSIVLNDVMKSSLNHLVIKDVKISLIRLSLHSTDDLSYNPCIMQSSGDISFESDSDIDQSFDFDDDDISCTPKKETASIANTKDQTQVEKSYSNGIETFLFDSLDLRESSILEDTVTIVNFKPQWKSVQTTSVLLCTP